MATANTIIKKITGFLKPVVSAALSGMSKADMDEVEVVLDVVYMAATTPAEVDEDGNVLRDEGLERLQTMMSSMDDTKVAGVAFTLVEKFYSEENEEIKDRLLSVLTPAVEAKFGPALYLRVNAKFLQRLTETRVYALNPGVVDAVIEVANLELDPDEFQVTVMDSIRGLTSIVDPFCAAGEDDTLADAGDARGEGAKVKIAKPLPHEYIEGNNTAPLHSGGPRVVRLLPNDEENRTMGFNLETFKASCLEANTEQIKLGLGSKASDDITADKWTCVSKEQALQYENGAKRHFLPRFGEGSTYLTAGVGIILGVGGTLAAQSMMAGSGEIEEDVSNVTPMRGRKTG